MSSDPVVEQFVEVARSLDRLVAAASVPSQRDVTALMIEAPLLKRRREANKQVLGDASRRSQRFGWIPFIGSAAHRDEDAAKAAKATIDFEWMTLLSRGRVAQEVLAKAKKAKVVLQEAIERGREGGLMPPGMADRVIELSKRVHFLTQTDGKSVHRSDKSADKIFQYVAELNRLHHAWHNGTPLVQAKPLAASLHQGLPASLSQNVPSVRLPGKRVQMSLDFDGTGQTVEEPRIWLPVSGSRTYEMIERGARLEREGGKRGSKLWIPVSERHKVDEFLPLAFRKTPTKFSFPPIRHNASGQNLWSVFDKSSWNHIRTTIYDRSGHRCMICGKQGGSLWDKIAPPEEKARGRMVECHEVWDWDEVDPVTGVGIQKLKRFLVVCPDCHMIFHDDQALRKAREVGLGAEAEDYIKTRRMLINRMDSETLSAQITSDIGKWEDNKSVKTWVLDLSHLAAQDFMNDKTLILTTDNRAGVTPNQIGGIGFQTEDGSTFQATAARDLARGVEPQPVEARAVFSV